MIYVHMRTRWCCGERADEVAIGYRRRPTPPTSLRKALLVSAIFTAALLTSFALMEATDTPDFKPTTTLLP